MNLLDRLMSRFSNDMAMDLGTANTLIHVRNRGIVLNEPSVVVLPQRGGGEVLAIGKEAKEMYGKTPASIRVVRPMKDGVIADFDSTTKMISYFIKSIKLGRFKFRPKIVICVPSGITQVEKKAVIDAAYGCGVREVHLLEEPMAAAIGTRMPIQESRGNMIVDIGGGTTEVAVISLFATAYSQSVRVAGDEMDDAIVRYLKKNFNLDVGVFEAEKIKIRIGAASKLEKNLEMKVAGRDLAKGTPTSITVTSEHVREAIDEPVRAILNAIKDGLDKITPELAADISSRGIVLAGGGALIKGLATRLKQEMGLPVYRSRDPLTAVVRGAGICLENFDYYRKVIIN